MYPDHNPPSQAYSSPTRWFSAPDYGRHGTIETHAVADPDMANRLTRAARRAPINPVMLATAIPVLIIVTIRIIIDPDASTFLLAALLMASTAVMILIVTFYMPARWRRFLTPGTPLTAEFSPSTISASYGEYHVTVEVDTITRAIADEAALQLWARQGLSPVNLVIPNELVPPDVATDLLRRFGGGESSQIGAHVRVASVRWKHGHAYRDPGTYRDDPGRHPGSTDRTKR